MIDIKKVKEEAEKEIAEEASKKAKEKLKDLIRKRDNAKQIVLNCEREIADAYAELGSGGSS